jgi:hypothetical protein
MFGLMEIVEAKPRQSQKDEEQGHEKWGERDKDEKKRQIGCRERGQGQGNEARRKSDSNLCHRHLLVTGAAPE